MSQMPVMDMKNSTLNDLEIKVDLPNRKKDARDKKEIDIEAVIKRRLNRDIKDNQMSLHKVHLTSLFANGFLTNRVLSDGYLMGLALKLLPNKTCYPSGPTSLQYFEAISKWYKSAISLKSQAMVLTKKKLKKKPPLKQSLAIQMTYKHAVCKRDFIYIFIIILRAMGIECRLVMNMQPLPMKPPQTDLHKVVMKRSSTEKSNEAESKSKKSKLNEDSDSNFSEENNSKATEAKKTTKAARKSISVNKSIIKQLEAVKKATAPPKKAASKKSTEEKKLKVEQNKSTEEKKPKAAQNKSTEEKKPRALKKDAPNKSTEEKKPKALKKEAPNKSTEEKKPKTLKKDANKSTELKKKETAASKLKKAATSKTEEPKPSTSKLEPPKRSSRKGSTSSLDVPVRRGASRSPSPNLKVEVDDKSKKKTTKTESLKVPVKRKSRSASPAKISPKFLKKEEVLEKEAQPKTTRKKKENEDDSKPKATKKTENVPKIKISSSLFSAKSKAAEKPSTSKAKAAPSTSKPARATTTGRAKKMEQLDGAMDYLSYSSSDEEMCQLDGADDSLKLKRPNLKRLNKRHIFNPIDSDDDFVKTPQKKPKKSPKIGSVDRRVFSSDEDVVSALESSTSKCDFWVEVFCEEENLWMPIDLIKGKVNKVESIQKLLTSPVNYVYAWNADQTIKDVTARYSKDWSNVVRKHRVEPSWLIDLIEDNLTKVTSLDKREDALMKKLHLEKALPTAVSDYKNHPLYALGRHLLKFEAIYPPNPPTLGFVRGEPVYARECVHTLHSRDIWLKQARTVKLGEKPYKIVKARPKWNRLTNEVIKDQPLEVFGFWQTQEYEPPVAQNGMVPRNAYGNVELFKTCMLPIGTVHLQLPGLNRVCKKLRIDCAPAMVGFDFHGGWSHPMYDGFVVCKEFEDKVVDEWNRAEDEYEKKEEEKYQEKVWGNWKKLIKAMLIREKLKLKYNFDQFVEPETKKKSSKK